MVLRVLAIGDTANNIAQIRKFVKKSQIFLINFPLKGAGRLVYHNDDIEFFDSLKISKQVKKIKKIKNDFDICIAMSWAGARIAYLADLNYIMYFVGGDIMTPPFEKNPRLPYLAKPLYNLNIFERKFYKNVFNNAIGVVAITDEYYNQLKKYRDDATRLDRIPMDTSVFNEFAEPIKREKTKFTFFSPQRNGPEKGMDIVWKALPMCKSDFEVLMIDWFDDRTEEEKQIIKKLLKETPKQVKFIPMIKREEMPRYYRFADAVLAQMRAGIQGHVEREGVLCKRAVIHYSDPTKRVYLDGRGVNPPFLPHSQDPKELAKTIDQVVESKEFREKLLEEEYKFIIDQCNPEKAGKDWDELFEKFSIRYKIIKRNSSPIKIKILNIIALMVEELIYSRTMKEKNIRGWGKEEYERLMK